MVLVISVRGPKPSESSSPAVESVTMDALHAVMSMYTMVVQALLHEFNVHASVSIHLILEHRSLWHCFVLLKNISILMREKIRIQNPASY